ncbi:AAA domain-containing protein [Halogranum amylolyticum]|uniref:AAA domain-containing protein n=1 Tax=Halogranum amylolyticum TaxID=660520 RepID=A0A1H8UH31_9EURY|nr:AAA domain-containing protein [Halogranum amylolyticum]
MSLLFEHAVEAFSPAEASLYAVTAHALETGSTDIPVRPIAEFACHHDSLHDTENEWTCIPLHGPDDATLTDEYVAYTDHAVRGPIFIVQGEDGHEPITADEFGATKLARRIRYWHSDYLPETLPAGYDAPLNNHEGPSNPIESDRLFEEFAEYVNKERNATRVANRDRVASKSARAIYTQGGAAIPSLAARGTTDGEYQFRVELDPELEAERNDDWAFFVEHEFGIYEGNEVLINSPNGDAPNEFPVAATVSRIRGLNVWLTLDWTDIDASGVIDTYLTSDREFGVSELLNPVPFDREREAIEALSEHRLSDVLAGTRPVTFSNDAAARSDTFDAELNQEQELAAKYALLADDLFCIHGPPGTGKTRTLLEIVRRAVDAGEDVLVCADSNQAVDNLVVGASTPDDVDAQSLHAYSQHGGGEFVLDRVNAARSPTQWSAHSTGASRSGRRSLQRLTVVLRRFHESLSSWSSTRPHSRRVRRRVSPCLGAAVSCSRAITDSSRRLVRPKNRRSRGTVFPCSNISMPKVVSTRGSDSSSKPSTACTAISRPSRTGGSTIERFETANG